MKLRAKPIVLLAIGLSGCGDSESEVEEAPPVVVEPVVEQPAPPLELSRPDSVGVLDFVNTLREAPTATEWAAAYPQWAASLSANDVNPDDEPGDGFGHLSAWCLRAASEEPVAPGVSVSRRFYFYHAVPDPPEDFSVPAATAGLRYHRDNCRLGLVTAEVFGGSGIDQGRQALLDRFAEELGPPPNISPGSDVGPNGLAGAAHFWRLPPVTVGVGVRAEGGHPASYAHTHVMDTTWSAGRLENHAEAWEEEAWRIALEAAAMPDRGRQLVRAATANFFTLRNAAALVTIATEGRDTLVTDTSPSPMGVRYAIVDFLLGDPDNPARSVALDQPAAFDLIPALEARGALYHPVRFAAHRVEYRGSLADSARAHPGGAEWMALLSIIGQAEACSWSEVIDRLEPLVGGAGHPHFRPWLRSLLGDAYATAFHSGGNASRGLSADRARREALAHYTAAVGAEADDERRRTAWRKAFLMANNYPFDPGMFRCDGPLWMSR